jgi:uncharacterized protein (TIGR00290 family)
MKVFSSWSGGKDCCLALWKAARAGHEVVCLLNMLDESGERSRSHGTKAGILRAQSEAMGIPIIQRATSWGDYERSFKDAALGLKQAGMEGGIFGDIDLQEHREWVERVCAEVGMEAILPLWREGREGLLREFIDLGFEAVVVAARASSLGPEWLGRKVDERFLSDLQKLGRVDLSGEGGEYHTLVTGGPLFSTKIIITEARRESRKGYYFLDFAGWRLMAREGSDENRG